MIQISREQIERELKGYYRTGCFHIYLDGSFDESLDKMSPEDLSTFTHEFIHYLQNISTPYGIFEANTRHQAAIEMFQELEVKDSINLPYKPTYSDDMSERLEWVKIMNGDLIPNGECDDVIDESYRMEFCLEDYAGKHRNGKKVHVTYRNTNGEIKSRYVGALDIKEGMAVAYQNLLGNATVHPDIPYNVLNILCKQHFPSVYEDIKKFICLCYTSLFDLSPASFFIKMCLDERLDSTRTGFQLFDEFVWTTPIKSHQRECNVSFFFNQMIETFKKSIHGFLRIDTPYIDTILDAVKLKDGNVPILNVINTDEPITADNIQALTKAVGLPFIHAKNRGWFFPAIDGQGASDIVHMIGLTWMQEFLVNRDKSRIGICPLASMCGLMGDFCYDQPWLETQEKCSFKVIAQDVKLTGKTFIIS